MKSIAPNTLIQNRYLIVHLIGKGGMGEVYLAVDQRLGSAVALKRTFFSDDALLGNAFEREARTLARLRHPVLPKVSDHFNDEGTQYLVMEHISGEDISKRLESMQKPFPLSWVLFWADQLLDSLTYLHTHEPPIIHRDIKPQNLKLTDENHIVLLDFGLSKNSTGETRAVTTGGGGSSIVGYTPHYAPMEQIRGTGTDARSDLYSLAATLYQILTGSVPPDALTRADSLINGLPDPVTPINELNSEVSKGISDVIIKAMAISQEQRYKTAREMQKALRDAYAKAQNETTASTVEYSAGSEPAILQAQQNQIGEKTEILPVVPLVSQTTPPPAINSNPPVAAEAANTTSDNGKNGSEFDATMRYEDNSESDAPKQADIKTEVFLAGSSSAIADAISEVNQKNYGREESFAGKEAEKKPDLEESRFFSEDELNQQPSFSPDATVPLMKFDNETKEAEAKFDSFSERENNSSTAADGAADSVIKPTVPVKQKSNKTLAIVGGLAALLLLTVGAVAVGLFLMRDSGTPGENTSPTPTSEPSVTFSPTIEQPVIIGNENSNTDTNNNQSTDNSNNSTDDTNSTFDSNDSGTNKSVLVPPVNNSRPQPPVNNSRPQPPVNNSRPNPPANNSRPNPPPVNNRPPPTPVKPKPGPTIVL